MFLINLNAEIVACILSFRKSRHKLNLENTSKHGFPPDLGEKMAAFWACGCRLSWTLLSPARVQPRGKKGEFRDWASYCSTSLLMTYHFLLKKLYLGRVFRKPVNVNSELNVNCSIIFSLFKNVSHSLTFGVVWDYYSLKLQCKQYKKNTSPKSYKLESKFFLTLGYLNHASNNPGLIPLSYQMAQN